MGLWLEGGVGGEGEFEKKHEKERFFTLLSAKN